MTDRSGEWELADRFADFPFIRSLWGTDVRSLSFDRNPVAPLTNFLNDVIERIVRNQWTEEAKCILFPISDDSYATQVAEFRNLDEQHVEQPDWLARNNFWHLGFVINGRLQFSQMIVFHEPFADLVFELCTWLQDELMSLLRSAVPECPKHPDSAPLGSAPGLVDTNT